MPTIEQWIALAGGLSIVLSALFVGFKGLRESKSAQVTSKAAIDARIDARIDAEMQRLTEVIAQQDARIAALETEREADKRRLDQMDRHIANLEALIPNPPGPPPRPWLMRPD